MIKRDTAYGEYARFKDLVLKLLSEDDATFSLKDTHNYKLPIYQPESHYLDLTTSHYYHALLVLRHHIKTVSDFYFGVQLGAKNIDLFMMTPSVSSPMGPGSDSEAISIRFGKLDTYLVDSSQFGFEPLLLNGLDKVYCYQPSMRGENPNQRHLNQFFHCEAEIKGDISAVISLVEGYVKILCEAIMLMPNIIRLISKNPAATVAALEAVSKSTAFPQISFDSAVDLLVRNGAGETITNTPSGRDINSKGEIALFEIMNLKTPLWITNYDRDRVPFYQKPDPTNVMKTLNADLLFPPLIKDSFGGEIVGCGQRQDNAREMRESLQRQGIVATPYEWYINLRQLPHYQTTSGFGLGIERFIAWSLCMDDIKNAIIYPRLKNVLTYP